MKLLTLVLATFRELFSKATLYVLLSISTLLLAGALGLSSEQTDQGPVLKMFGNTITSPTRLDEIIPEAQTGLAKGLFLGIMLFGVFATASVIPDSMEKGTIDLYLSKPLARWELLLGKYLGSVAVMFLVILYFIGGIWLGFGTRIGVWNMQFLFSSLTMTFMFACIFSLVLFLGVMFRNAAIPIIGCFLYLMLLDNPLASREMSLYLLSDNKIYRGIVDGLYYLFPNIADMQKELYNQIMHKPMEWKPFAHGLLSSAVFFSGAAVLFNRKDF